MIGLASAFGVVNSFDELADKGVKRLNEEFAKWSPVLLAVAQGLEQVRTEAYNMLNWLQRAIAAADRFWKARAAITNPKAWESPEAMRDALRHGLGIEGEASPPAMPELAQPRTSPGSPSSLPSAAVAVAPAAVGRALHRRMRATSPASLAPSRAAGRTSTSSRPPPTGSRSAILQLMDRLRRQWLHASGERIGLIEINRDAQLAALDEQELGE